ncbi:unnamed protein product [Diamesa hyperborea]
MHLLAIISGFLLLIALPNGNECASPYERLLKKEQQVGLYDSMDKVVVLNAADFKELIFEQNVASFVEFYNSFCGACQRFATIWKATADNVNGWRNVSQIAALDCSVDENNDICREFEVMRYPTMRYFSPYYKKEGEKQIGVTMDHLLDPTMEDLIVEFALKLQNETTIVAGWPDFTRFNGATFKDLFNNAPETVEQIFLIVDDANTVPIATQVALDFSTSKIARVRLVSSTTLLPIQPTVPHSKIELVKVAKDGTVQKFELSANVTREEISGIIKTFLKISSSAEVQVSATPSNQTDNVQTLLDRFIYDQSKTLQPTPIFRADIEQALKFTLFHEISQQPSIEGERLLALKQFLAVIERYYPLTSHSRNFIVTLRNFVMEHPDGQLNGEVFEHKMKELQTLNEPVFLADRYVGCYSGMTGLRRFPCSLWTMFHFLTVQASEKDDAEDPLEVLQAMHEYVKYFFGCTDCARHFQVMAARNKIWNVTSKDSAVLWMWEAHNEVNQRLSGDLTEDPSHPKLQFPSAEDCSDCRRHGVRGGGSEWDKTATLVYLKNHYALRNLNDLGIEPELLPHAQSYAGVRQILGSGPHLNIVSVVYFVIIVCFITIVLKFYFRRGYRKKLYTHDILGKV